MLQRFFDIFFSGVALVCLLPVLAPIAVVLRVTGEHEIFFFQRRIGKDRKEFKLYKFATMLKDSPNLGTKTITIKNDPRVLPFGRLLRKTKVNELPQLLNVFLGDMSVIGPRPLTVQTFSAYAPEIQGLITSVRPGLSGIGSIVFRSEEEIMQGTKASPEFYNTVIAPYKGALETWYVTQKSISLYFIAICLTVWSVLHPTTKAPWSFLRGLPEPPEELRGILGYP